MPFQLSPGVLVTEKDLTSIIPAVSTSRGAFAGVFPWGPVLDPTTISSETELVSIFGKPTDSNAAFFFTAANFLAYTNNLLTIRVDTENHRNAVASGTAVKINNRVSYDDNYAGGAGSVGLWAAKYPGVLGNSLRVEICDAGGYSAWGYKGEFTGAPGTSTYASAQNSSANDELHVIVIDAGGLWTGTKNTILEKFAFLSKASDARRADGSNQYYKDVINDTSKYIYWMGHPTSLQLVGTPSTPNWGKTTVEQGGTAYHSLGSGSTAGIVGVTLTGGVDDLTASDSQLETAWLMFNNSEVYDISLIPVGPVSPGVAQKIIQQVAETRKDCVAFVSPVTSSGGRITGTSATEITTATIAFRNDSTFNVNSSYGVLDSGWKYMYDRYNDVYRWVPLCGDTAGLCARTDYTNDPWYSPGGYNRGQYKGVVRLSLVPNQTQRDLLYQAGINPVVSFPGQGTVLFGDKTLLTRPSAFDRINVRRLFIVLEKAIAIAAKYQLFEFNDSFTRAQFRSMVEPFLRDVQGRRGLYDFRVKCDEINNTGEVIDRNEFVADIFIKPARSINFITLNFIAARTAVSFDEIGG